MMDFLKRSGSFLPFILFFLCWVSWLPLSGQVTIYGEDFSGYSDGTMNGGSGVGSWSASGTDCDDGGDLNAGPGASRFGVYNGEFVIEDIEGGPCCGGGGGGNSNLISFSIDISGYCDVEFSITLDGTGSFECDEPGGAIYGCNGMTDNSQDQIEVLYDVDGLVGGTVAYICGSIGLGAYSITGLSGDFLIIDFIPANKANGEIYTIDNVFVTGTPISSLTLGTPDDLCEADGLYDLTQLEDPSVSGSWSGDGVVGSSDFDPGDAGEGTFTLTFEPDPGECAEDTEVDITVFAATDDYLGAPPEVCDVDGPFDLTSLEDFRNYRNLVTGLASPARILTRMVLMMESLFPSLLHPMMDNVRWRHL